jgi:alkylated DNA repair dioxygenase AlkB
VITAQRCLFGDSAPWVDDSFSDCHRTELAHGAWIEHQQGWFEGHQAAFDELLTQIDWQHQRRPMYDRVVDVPRLLGSLPEDYLESRSAVVRSTVAAAVEAGADALTRRYARAFDRIGLALYRNGRDSVAWHGDTIARDLPQAMVATVSLGEPRRFLLRPVGGGESLSFELGHGDLMVMGGTCQRTWQHAVPKVARAGPRIALMFRPSKTSTTSDWTRPRVVDVQRTSEARVPHAAMSSDSEEVPSTCTPT